jgi:hypothetical protein
MYTFGKTVENEWALVHVCDEHGNPTNYIAIKKNILYNKKFDQYLQTKQLIGLCAYQNFPEPIKNPYDSDRKESLEGTILEKYGHRILLWCHCFKYPKQFIPPGYPLLLQSDSDHYNNAALLKKADTVEKKYDFFCSLPNGDWNGWIRGSDTAKKWLNVMADKMSLKILVGGGDRRDGFSDAIDFTGHLPWYQYIHKMNECKYMFNASRYDASPRILVEALSLNIPVFLNQDILGGWKYIHPSTGAFFFYDEPIEPAVRAFLRNTYKPKEWMERHFDSRASKQLLANTLHTIVSLQYADLFDGIVCIHLLHKESSKTHIHKEFQEMGIPDTMVHCIEEEPVDIDCEYYRKSVYHRKALAYAKEKQWNRCLIVESNFSFTLVKERFLWILSEFCANFPTWDVFMLTSFWKNLEDTTIEYIKKVQSASTVSGYIVQSHYYDTLFTKFFEAGCLRRKEYATNKTNVTSFAIDQYWRSLQKRDQFYISEPYSGRML